MSNPDRQLQEQQIIGLLIKKPNLLASTTSQINVDDFTLAPTNTVLSQIIEMRAEEVDLIALAETLAINEKLDDIGGFAFLAESLQSVTDTANDNELVSQLN